MLRDYVAWDSIEAVRDMRQHSAPRSSPSGAERVDFDYYAYFPALTDRAVKLAAGLAEPFATLLRSLADCYPAEAGPLDGQQRKGATYRQLAYIAHLAGMGPEERRQWYRIAETVPLSQRHAGHIIARLQRRAA